MGTIEWSDFEKVLLVAGTVLRVEGFPEAGKPALQAWRLLATIKLNMG